MKVTTDSCIFGSLFPVFPGNGIGKNILDIGVGTGLLSLMCAQKNQKACIEGIEIDHDAYMQATENVTLSPWAGNINILYKDICNFESSKKYDLIVCNPPFYENELKSSNLQKNIAQHSEQLTLATLLPVIKQYLSATGIYYLLLPFKRLDEIKKVANYNALSIDEIFFIQQTTVHPFFRIVVRGGYNKDDNNEPKIAEMAIKNEAGQYTREFVSLLKDYYLYL